MAHERRLPRSHLAAQPDDVARRERGREGARDRGGRLLAVDVVDDGRAGPSPAAQWPQPQPPPQQPPLRGADAAAGAGMSPPTRVRWKRERSFVMSFDVHDGQATSVVPLADTSSSNRWLQDVHSYS